jgi:transcriptional regulator with XRE-family HTH domain
MERVYIREKRKKKGLLQSDLADMLDIDTTMVGKVESGVRNPSVPLARRWAKCLGISERNILKYFFAY